MKERCKAKAKAKAKAKSRSNPDFFLWFRCVSLVLAYLFSVLVLATLSLLYSGQGSQHGPVPTYVVSRSLLVVTQSGSDPAARHGSVPRTDAIY